MVPRADRISWAPTAIRRPPSGDPLRGRNAPKHGAPLGGRPVLPSARSVRSPEVLRGWAGCDGGLSFHRVAILSTACVARHPDPVPCRWRIACPKQVANDTARVGLGRPSVLHSSHDPPESG